MPICLTWTKTERRGPMNQRAKPINFLSSILLPAVLLTVPLVGTSFFLWDRSFEARAAPIRREIAENYAVKWGRCDLAAKWDATVPCSAR